MDVPGNAGKHLGLGVSQPSEPSCDARLAGLLRLGFKLSLCSC